MRTPAIPLALLLVGGAAAQPDTSREAVNWAAGLGSRFENLTNPVVSSYALGQLAAHVCDRDKTAGAGLFRSALSRLNTVSDALFLTPGPILPVSSFTGLWTSIMPAAERCDSTLGQLLDKQRTAARLADERLRANEKLETALAIIEGPSSNCLLPRQPPSTSGRPIGSSYYRCVDYPAQLADNALTTGDPDTLEFAVFTKILLDIRDRATDLTDDLFAKSLDLALAQPAPRMTVLNVLGRYLFTAPTSTGEPGEQRVGLIAGGVSITDMRAIRRMTNPSSISAYVDAVLKAADATGSPFYNAESAYSVVYQLLATARQMDLESVPRLEQALANIQVRSSAVQQIQAFLGAGSPAIPENILRRDRLIDRVLSETRQKHFDAARNLLTDLDDFIVRNQLGPLILYAEALDAIEVKDFDQAVQLANRLQAGVKRALLYAGIMASAPPEVALQVASLATRDGAALTAEHRVAVLSAASVALIHADQARALALVNEVLKSLNDVGVQPHLAVFDSRRERTAAASGDAASTDVPQILLRDSILTEVIDSGRHWHMVELHVPPPTAFSLPGLVRNASALDFASLEVALLGIRDETRRASALNALAELRLKTH